MAPRGCRHETVVLSKGAHPDPAWRSRLDPGSIASDLRHSLERLATDRIDIYPLHRDDQAVPVGEIVDALHEHVMAGRVRSIGVSNWSPARLEAAAVYAAARGRTPFTSSSVYFGLAAPARPYTPGCLDAWDPASRDWYATNLERWPLFAWSSQSGGFFSDGFDPARAVPEAVGAWDTEANRARRERARELGRRLGVSAAQVALAYVLSQPFQPFALAGMRDADAVRAAWTAASLELDAGQREWLAGPNGD